jgi:hypothetical protein
MPVAGLFVILTVGTLLEIISKLVITKAKTVLRNVQEDG